MLYPLFGGTPCIGELGYEADPRATCTAEYPDSERFHLHYADLTDFSSLCKVLRCGISMLDLVFEPTSVLLDLQSWQCIDYAPGTMPHFQALCRLTKPDEVYNLGAQSHVQVSFELPQYTAEASGVVSRSHKPLDFTFGVAYGDSVLQALPDTV